MVNLNDKDIMMTIKLSKKVWDFLMSENLERIEQMKRNGETIRTIPSMKNYVEMIINNYVDIQKENKKGK